MNNAFADLTVPVDRSGPSQRGVEAALAERALVPVMVVRER